jgi:predicted  nucleic acid-binding Zn-ribbon protein
MIGEKHKCLRCGYEWNSRVEGRPKQCPNCKAQRWDEVARKRGRPAVAEAPRVEPRAPVKKAGKKVVERDDLDYKVPWEA